MAPRLGRQRVQAPIYTLHRKIKKQKQEIPARRLKRNNLLVTRDNGVLALYPGVPIPSLHEKEATAFGCSTGEEEGASGSD